MLAAWPGAIQLGHVVYEPCHGVSPNGLRWVYAQPQHTGTDTVGQWLHENAARLGADPQHCWHSHYQKAPYGTNFTFSFVQNPFRRVLTWATSVAEVIPTGDRQDIGHTRKGSHLVAAFRAYVLGSRAHRKPLCVQRNSSVNAKGCIWAQAAMVRGFPKPWVLNHTANLQAGFEHVLALLGYPEGTFQGFHTVHCQASCTHGAIAERTGAVHKWGGVQAVLKRNVSYGDMLRTHAARPEWYDEATAARVVELFADDFDAFGFSHNPQHMWDARGHAKSLDLRDDALR